ncbi:unnamed protein product [Phytophthora fragariaefolia]|uniref:Unnamed protein product n=1 Tax=Phytophthora fragariaefolia TaxID=1490495 RepID=A0A9W6XNX1_9STRA|nr:unnamed protein product [Phytophthora fragariaefolia]
MRCSLKNGLGSLGCAVSHAARAETEASTCILTWACCTGCCDCYSGTVAVDGQSLPRTVDYCTYTIPTKLFMGKLLLSRSAGSRASGDYGIKDRRGHTSSRRFSAEASAEYHGGSIGAARLAFKYLMWTKPPPLTRSPSPAAHTKSV